MSDQDSQDMSLELEINGRSAGEVSAPNDVEPDLPPLTDEEVDQAISDLGVSGLKLRQIHSMRKLGQVARESGVLSVGRGIVLCGIGQLLDIADRAKQLEKECPEYELKDKFMRVRRDAALGLANAGKVILDSEPKKAAALPQMPEMPRLPEFGEAITNPLTQINGDIHIHKHG